MASAAFLLISAAAMFWTHAELVTDLPHHFLALSHHHISYFVFVFVLFFIIQLSFVFLTCVSVISFCFKVLASRL